VSGIGEESEVELFICSSVSQLVGSFLGGLAWILRIGLYVHHVTNITNTSKSCDITMPSTITPGDMACGLVFVSPHAQVGYCVQYSEKQSATTIGAGPGHVPSSDLG
jgi:hypothetical protein